MTSESKMERLGRLLRDANAAWRAQTYGLMAARGYPEIRPAHSPIFRYLPTEGARTVDLAAQASIAKQSMGYLVKDLVKTGYLELVQDPADGRAQLVRFTTKGIEAQRTLADISTDLEKKFTKSIGEEQLGLVKAALDKLVQDQP